MAHLAVMVSCQQYKKATEVAFARKPQMHQLRDWSTSLFLAIPGTLARTWPPPLPLARSAVLRRRAAPPG